MLRKSFYTSMLIALSGAVIFSSPAARSFADPLASSRKLRVMTYNIHVGVGMDKKLDLPRIACPLPITFRLWPILKLEGVTEHSAFLRPENKFILEFV